MNANNSSATVWLAGLEPTPEVLAARGVVNGWPLASVGAFLSQPGSDAELSDAYQVTQAARLAAIAQIADHRDHEDAASLKGLNVALDAAGWGGTNLLQTYTEAAFMLGMLYGMRLANREGAQ